MLVANKVIDMRKENSSLKENTSYTCTFRQDKKFTKLFSSKSIEMDLVHICVFLKVVKSEADICLWQDFLEKYGPIFMLQHICLLHEKNRKQAFYSINVSAFMLEN